jgi:hypothetical protein
MKTLREITTSERGEYLSSMLTVGDDEVKVGRVFLQKREGLPTVHPGYHPVDEPERCRTH